MRHTNLQQVPYGNQALIIPWPLCGSPPSQTDSRTLCISSKEYAVWWFRAFPSHQPGPVTTTHRLPRANIEWAVHCIT